ncbi:MAG: hypothetical protein HZB51_17205 [Chloroflexi bacterium]|nr:hypothetical protein [Chloroflexota bacterium]
MDNTTLVAIAVAAIAAILILATIISRATVRKQTTAKLQERFGPEYDRTVEQYGDQREAEKELRAREKRVANFQIRTLTREEHDRFAQAWRNAQARFVDEPSEAVADADRLVEEVMRARGYPTGDFEQRVADISVDHAGVITNYRLARDIALANRKGKASTEDLRQAMVRYRSLFDELLQTEGQPKERVKEMVR